MARLCEQAFRYEDMLEYLKDLIKNKNGDFTIEERNLISSAAKNHIINERKAIKLVCDIAGFEKFQKYDFNMKQYRKRLEKSLQSKCIAISDLCEN